MIGGNDVVSECFDYELSAGGSSYSLYFSGIMADYFLEKDGVRLGSYGDMKKMCLSDDGRDVGFRYERNPLEFFASKDKMDKHISGILRYMYPGSFGEFDIIDNLDNFIKAGEIAFYRNNYYPGYYYSFQNSQGVWKLFKNSADMKVAEREILMIKP